MNLQLQQVALLWSLSARRAASYRAPKAKVGVLNTLIALQCEDFTILETTCLSLGSLKTETY